MKTRKFFIKYLVIVAITCFCICAEMTGICAQTKNTGDIKALKKIISVQNKRGAKVSTNINNKKQYVWNKRTGRLKTIQWRGKQLKGSINFNALTGLRKLNVSKNNITKLSIQKLVKLTNFNCSHNQLKKIEIESNEILIDINCSHNKLKRIGIKSCYGERISISMNCSYNHLKSLSDSKNVEICDLNCSYNKLKKIKINRYIDELNCSHNQLKKLKLNKGVDYLDCSYNQLKTLNVASWLYTLNCSHNQLKKFNVKDVEGLDCSYNKLKKLNLKSKNMDYLDCSHNQLKTLKSNSKKMDYLDCSYNQLKKINLANKKSLTALVCSYNQLTKMNIFKNLSWLKCDHNELTALNIQKPSKNLDEITYDAKVTLTGIVPKVIYDSVKDTKVSIAVVNKKTIKMNIINNTGNWLCIQESFILEKKVNGQWETVECIEDTSVKTLLFIPKSTTRELIIEWKDYFGKKLGKGEYRMKLLGAREFTIK